MPYIQHNETPEGRNGGDCTVRAIAKALGQSWELTYLGLTLQGYMMKDMPPENAVWGAYLKSMGFRRHMIPDSCPDCYTVADFAADHPQGTYLLALPGHVVCVEDGDWYDTWDSGGKTPLYYWKREG